MNYRKCIVCNKQQYRKKDEKMFFATFPLDESRCRNWVKLIGIKELVFLPIEKLHTVRFVCGDHFEKKSFNRKNNRLKKTALPKLKLTLPPLTDDQLIEFPLHISGENEEDEYEHLPSVVVPQLRPNTELYGNTAETHTYESQHKLQREDEYEHLPSIVTPQLRTKTELYGNIAEVHRNKSQNELQRDAVTSDNQYHAGYKCNECGKALSRFRYSCLECEDYDICTSCEARGVHGTHYMLRVPGARPHDEVREVLDAVRSHVSKILNKNSTVLNDVNMSEGIKEELEEVNDPFHGAMMETPLPSVEEETPSEIGTIDKESLNLLEDDYVLQVENADLESIPLINPDEFITRRDPQRGDSIHRRVLSDKVISVDGKSILPIGDRTVILRGMSETDLTNHSTTAKMAPLKTTTMPANIEIKQAKRKTLTIVATSINVLPPTDCFVPRKRVKTDRTLLI